MHPPVPAGVAVAHVGLAQELAVRHVHQPIRYGDPNVGALRLVAPLVLARPPHARALALVGGVDPVAAGRVLAEGQAAETALLLRQARVAHVDGVGAAGAQRGGEVDAERVIDPRVLSTRAYSSGVLPSEICSTTRLA